MTDLPNWLETRKSLITGSDLSALVGLNRFITPWALHARKRGLIPDQSENEAMLWGSLLESAVLRHPALAKAFDFVPWGEYDAGPIPCEVIETDRVPVLIDRSLGLGGTPDAIGTTLGGPILGEVKTVGDRSFQTWEPCDESEPVAEGLRAPTRQLPDSHVLQVTTYMGLLGLDTAIVMVLIGGQRLEVHRVAFDPAVYAALSTHALKALDAIAREEEPPFDPYADGANVGHWLASRPLSSSVTPVTDPELVRLATEAGAFARIEKAAKREGDARKAALAHAFGLAGIGKALFPGLGKATVIDLKAQPEKVVTKKATEASRYLRLYPDKKADGAAALAEATQLILTAGDSGEESDE